MKAVACQNAELSVVNRETPVPGKGQLLIEVTRGGICGSDLHARHHCDDVAASWPRWATRTSCARTRRWCSVTSSRGRVAEHGPGCRKTAPRVRRSLPCPWSGAAARCTRIGLSALAPGAYAEQMLVEESLAFPVPNGLPPDHAALTEPMAVGLHAVRRGEVKKGDVAIVIGCGPVGLSVILHLKAKGVRQVIASDFSPGRRALAQACGADVVIDPAAESPYETGAERPSGQHPRCARAGRRVDREGCTACAFRGGMSGARPSALGSSPKHPVVFECVGVPGVIDDIIAEGTALHAHRRGRASAWATTGSARRWRSTRRSTCASSRLLPARIPGILHKLAEGDVDARPLITGTVGLEGVDAAFEALGDPETHAKILIDPKRGGAEISA